MNAEMGDLEPTFARLDQDHVGLLALIKRIGILLCETPADRIAIQKALDDLVVLTVEHFNRENALMTDETVEEFTLHKQDHRNLARCLTDFCEAFRSGRMSPSVAIAFDLDSWLVFHIERFDTRLHAILGV